MFKPSNNYIPFRSIQMGFYLLMYYYYCVVFQNVSFSVGKPETMTNTKYLQTHSHVVYRRAM